MTDAQQIVEEPPEALRVQCIGVDGEDYLVAAGDLAELASLVGARTNPLSALPAGKVNEERKAQLAREFAQMPDAHRQRLAIALGVLGAPAKVAMLHHTIADEVVSRGMLAWSVSVPDQIVALAHAGNVGRISFWLPIALRGSFAKILAAEGKLSDDRIGCKVPLGAVVVFLAILDQLRAMRLHAALTHSLPSTIFSPTEIADRLRDASAEDFRWPLNFLDKVMPGLAAKFTPADIALAVEDLVKAELIEVVMEAGPTSRYELSLAGKAIADEVLHEVSKLALSVCDQHPDGRFGYDITLWIRGPFHLFFFAMSGKDGVIAAVDNEEFEQLVNRSLAPPPAPAVPAEEKPAAEAKAEAVPQQPPAAVWYLSRDGKSEGPYNEAALKKMLEGMPPETLVWSEGSPDWISARDAGLVVAPGTVTCPRCGTKAEAGKQFCGECGGMLTH
jgi:hypothetical protein